MLILIVLQGRMNLRPCRSDAQFIMRIINALYTHKNVDNNRVFLYSIIEGMTNEEN